MSASTPSPIATTLVNATGLIDVAHLSTISRFHGLLQYSRALVQSYGPYTTHPNTTVFTRAPHPSVKPYGPSSVCMATSLAAAQDSIGSAQLPGPAHEDLKIFKLLWQTTVDVLEEVLATGDLDHESFGWGIWGLSAGYMYPPSATSYELFEEHKHRLHEALLALPTMDAPRRKMREVLKGEGRVDFLAKINRQVHICANLVLQRFRQEGWHRIRWWHGVKIAERWIARLDLTDETFADDYIDKEHSYVPAPGREVDIDSEIMST